MLEEGREEEALQFIEKLEKEEILKDEEKLECLELKIVIFNQMFLIEEWYNFSELLYKEAERLEKQDYKAVAIVSRMWAMYLGGKLGVQEAIEESRKICTQLEDLIKIASNVEIEKIEILLNHQKAYLYSSVGELDSALELFKKKIEIASTNADPMDIINVPLAYLRIGDIYQTMGELELALDNFKQGLSLFKGNCFNFKVNRGMSFGYLGNVYYQKNELDKAREYFKKAFEIYNEINYFVFIGYIFDGLIKVLLVLGDFELAEQKLNSFNKINEQYEYHSNKVWYQLSKSRLLKSRTRFHDWVKAEEMLKEVVEKSRSYVLGPMSPTNTAIIELCDLLLKELELTSNSDILNEIRTYVELLQEYSNLQNSYSFLSESMLLQAKLELINLQIDEAKKKLKQAQTIAEDHGLILLAQKLSNEHDILLEQSDLWEEFKRNNVPLSDRLKLASIDGVLDRLKGQRQIDPPELVDEHSLLILIMSEGGAPLFSYPFTDEWKFDEDLFGGFLSAFNSISDEVFSEGLDRVKIGNYTVLMEPIERFSVCYLFKGQAYPAKQKLTKFIERIQNDTTTWQTFEKFSKTSQVAELQDIPMVENLLIDIFKN